MASHHHTRAWSRPLSCQLALVIVVGILSLHFLFRFSCPCYGRGESSKAKCVSSEVKTRQGLSADTAAEADTSSDGDDSATPVADSESGEEATDEDKTLSSPTTTSTQSSKEASEASKGSFLQEGGDLEAQVQAALLMLKPEGGKAPIDHSALADVAASRKSKRGPKSSLIVAVAASHGYTQLLLNCVRSLKKVGLGSLILVLAFDKSTLAFCEEHKMKAIAAHPYGHTKLPQLLDDQTGTNESSIYKLHIPTLAALLELLNLQREVLLIHADTAFLRNPINTIRKDGLYPDADLALMSESLSWENAERCSKAKLEGGMRVDKFAFGTPRAHETYGTVYTSPLSTGILLARPTNATLLLVRTWLAVLLTRGKLLSLPVEEAADAQGALNALVRQGATFKLVGKNVPGSKAANSRLLWAFNHRVKLGILSPAYFVNGHVYFVQRLSHTLHKRPVAIHNSFQLSSTQEKMWRFREGQLWSVDKDQWYTKGNFLSFEAALPEDVVNGIPNAIDKHIAAVSFYYLSIRNALAIAQVLNRTLILPTVTCYCDKYWWSLSEACRMPGADEDPPYAPCPMDHILKMTAWHASGFPFRESSFLENPQVPESVKKSRRVISVVPRPSTGTANLQTLEKDSIPSNAVDYEVGRLLGRLSRVRVLHLETAADAFCRFKSLQSNTEFDARTVEKGLFGEDWCCSPWKDEWGEETKETLRFRKFKVPRHLAEVKLRDCQSEPTIAFDLER